MSERPTPETDAAIYPMNQVDIVWPEFARKLERERDEARELLASEKITRNHIIKRSVEVERERDEARELIDDIWITATSDHRFIMPPSKKQIPQHIEGIIKAYDKAHDDWTPEEIKTLMRERDEALEKAERYRIEANAMMLQRDEARDLLRILAGLVAYGLGQSGEEWSLEAMRQATTAIQNAKSLEAAK